MTRKVLVVDDSEICVEMVRVILEEDGLEVVAAMSADEIGPALNAQAPDVVLVDLSMPGLEGDALIGEVRKHEQPGGTILLHSERSESELKALSTKWKLGGFVRKGEDPVKLVQAVREVLERSAEGTR